MPGVVYIAPERELENKDYLAEMSHPQQLQFPAYNKTTELSQKNKGLTKGTLQSS